MNGAPIEWAEQHDNGVHVNCDPDECFRAGRVDFLHGHDYSGPLICGCYEWRTE